MNHPDERLVADFTRRRDEQSFRELYRRHTPMLFALACRLSGCASRAEELTQEAWVRAIEAHERFDGRSAYRTWVTGILINCFRESLRRQRKTAHSFDESNPRDRSGVVAAFPDNSRPHDLIDVERALSALPPGYREIVLLHDLNGYTHEEISTLLGISPGTSKSQLTRGRARLREMLNPQTTDKRGTS